MTKKILLSGIKPTGRPHIGNYFGAMKQFVDLQDEYQSYIFIPDLHALTSVQNKEEMKQLIMDLTLDYLAIGIDPKNVTIFKQSDVSEHTELCWIFDTITPMPYLLRAHAFKAAVDRAIESVKIPENVNIPLGKTGDQLKYQLQAKLIEAAGDLDVNVGLFNYPMLMAADILLYDADIVPVGQDQKQHVEYARDTAQKFNGIFGDMFKLPQDYIMKEVAVVPGTDGRKMSKSYGNTIPLFASDEEIEKAVMSIVTDSGGDRPEHVYAIHKLFKTEAELAPLYEENKGKYKILKEALIVDLKKFITPLREKRAQLAQDTDYVLDILKEGGKRAKQKAEKKMDAVREAVGVKLY